MELFCKNVPDQISRQQLKKLFVPILKDFSVYTFDCQKRGRRCAVLTFLDVGKAQSILDRYGQVARGGIFSTRLQIAGRFVELTRSKKNPPDEFLLRHLQEKEFERVQRVQVPVATTGPLQKSFEVTSFACGSWFHDNYDPVFVEFLRIQRRGTISFEKTYLKVVLKPQDVSSQTYLIEFDYTSMTDSIYLATAQAPSLTVSVKLAPRLYESGLSSQMRFSTLSGSKFTKERVSSFGEEDCSAMATCFTYQFSLQNRTDLQRIHELKRQREVPTIQSYPTKSILPSQPYHKQMAYFLETLNSQSLPYRMKYQLQMLAWDGILPPGTVSELFSASCQLLHQTGPDRAAQVIRKFRKRAIDAGLDSDGADFNAETLAKLMFATENALGYDIYGRRISENYPNMISIHRVIITPLGTYLCGPYQEPMNRVLRKYAAHSDNFLRVEFSEETGEAMRFDRDTSLDKIFQKRFKSVLRDGIVIGGKRFEFLGFSHSSLRSQVCWFMSSFKSSNGLLLDARSIIPLLGDFSKILSPAKCAARIGQTFTETVNSIAVDTSHVTIAKDIKTCVGGRERIFSDGVGTLSHSLLRKILKGYALQKTVKPTVFQIRIAGMSAFLSLWSLPKHVYLSAT